MFGMCLFQSIHEVGDSTVSVEANVNQSVAEALTGCSGRSIIEEAFIVS